MIDAADAKELIDESIERAEAEHEAVDNRERAVERQFRDRVSIMVGVFAVALAIIHMSAAGAARKSLLTGISASDNFAYMQAKIVREAVFSTAAASASASAADRLSWKDEAKRLREPDAAGHGIGQLKATGAALREEGRRAAVASEGYELGETALQMAIVLLSIALVARSRPLVGGAVLLAGTGVAVAVATAAGLVLPWMG
jgi:hypothetical protein